MTPFGLRRRLVLLLGGTPAPEPEDEDEEETEVVWLTPGSPLPPALAAALGRHQELSQEPLLPASATMRNGPSSAGWAMKVVDCNGQADPAFDAEVQALLSSGWEPFSVTKFSSFTGAEGIRMYFKRQRVPGPPAHA